MEADFQRYYGLHLGDLLFSPSGIDVARLGNLIKRLPADGATGGRWPVTDQLLAVIAELSDASLAAFVRAHAKRPPPHEPLDIQWPGRRDAAPKTKPATRTEIMDFFKGSLTVVPKGEPDAS